MEQPADAGSPSAAGGGSTEPAPWESPAVASGERRASHDSTERRTSHDGTGRTPNKLRPEPVATVENLAERLAERVNEKADVVAAYMAKVVLNPSVDIAQIFDSSGQAFLATFLNDLSVSVGDAQTEVCLLYTSPSPRDRQKSRMPSSA